MAQMMEMARDLGNAMARTDEYQALKRVIASVDDDREIQEMQAELQKLEATIEASLRAGQEPDEETRQAYESAIGRLQASSSYQRLVAAQANFDKIVQKVNETIMQGLQEGADSRIILSP